MSVVRVDIDINQELIESKIAHLLDEKTMLEVNNTLARFCNDYVPMLEGPLSQTIQVTSDCVTYIQPYSHYQYYLHDMHADLAGLTNRTRIHHPKASSYWDKAMMLEKGDAFKEEIRRIIARRAREIYGY